MSELRWILLIAGFALIAGIYFWGSRGRPPSADEELEGLLKPKATPQRGQAARPSGQAERTEPQVTLTTAGVETTGESDLDPDERYEGLDEPAIGRREASQSERSERRGTLATKTFDASPPTEQPPVSEPAERQTTAERAGPRKTGEERAADTERARPPGRQEPATGHAAPHERDETTRATGEREPPRSEQPSAQTGKERPRQKILALRVVAPRPSRFDGSQLADALREAGLTHGQYDIFHRLDGQGRPLFSLASLVEPGTFDPETMAEAAYPGVALFSVMPGPQPPLQTFDQMVKAARLLATRLDGSLLDEAGAPLSDRGLEDLREKIASEQHQLPGGPEPV